MSIKQFAFHMFKHQFTTWNRILRYKEFKEFKYIYSWSSLKVWFLLGFVVQSSFGKYLLVKTKDKAGEDFHEDGTDHTHEQVKDYRKGRTGLV